VVPFTGKLDTDPDVVIRPIVLESLLVKHRAPFGIAWIVAQGSPNA